MSTSNDHSYIRYFIGNTNSEKQDGNLNHLDIKQMEQLIWDHNNISRQQSDHVIHFIAIKCHDLRYILKACDDAAAMILHTIYFDDSLNRQYNNNNDNHYGLEEPHVSLACLNWLNSLKKSSSSPQDFAK